MTTALFEGQFADEFALIDGLRLHYTDWNPSGDRHLLLLHGLNVQAHTWDPFAAAAVRLGYRVLALDLRGHGQSGWTQKGYRVADFARDVTGLIDQLGIAEIDLVGHSLGARVAIAVAGDQPDRVRRLVLSDTGPEFPVEAAKFAFSVVSGAGGETRGFATEEAARAFYTARHGEWAPVFIDLHVRYQLRRNWADKLIFRADPDLFWILSSAGRRDDAYVWTQAARVTAPTLIMWGVRSPFFDDDIIARMQKVLAHSEVVRTNSGHYIPREAPEEFYSLVSDFLTRE
jgi:pimeloyl-ACP methyl ester carboxylesterase